MDRKNEVIAIKTDAGAKCADFDVYENEDGTTFIEWEERSDDDAEFRENDDN
ncbi:MAG: hypothetical protein KKB09_07200 [Nanoarchaeota archaeon]|nr:hypothetical protein [Nanoarchaeota archaeon]